MERMWSPWRSRHLEAPPPAAPGDGRSVFARLEAAGDDEEHLILWRGRLVFVIMNRYPYNNGHLLVVPYRQVDAYEALTPAEQVALARTADRCVRWLKAALAPHGFNIGLNQGEAGGAGVPDHLHLHVVARWRGDTNFMPTLAETKVVPEALRDTYRKLRTVIDAERDAGASDASGDES